MSTGVTIVLVAGLVIFIGLILFGGGCYFVSKMASRIDQKSNSGTAETKEGWPTYANDEWKFSVQYPGGFSKEVSTNNDGATFTSTSPDITLRAFSVLASKSESEYLSGILSLAQDSILYSSVTEVSSENYQLGELSGIKKVWKYTRRDGKIEAEVHIAAANSGNMYNISMVCDYSIYGTYLSLIEGMAKTFKTL